MLKRVARRGIFTPCELISRVHCPTSLARFEMYISFDLQFITNECTNWPLPNASIHCNNLQMDARGE